MKGTVFFALLLQSLQLPHTVEAATKTRRLQGDVCVTVQEVESNNLIEQYGGDSVFLSANGKVVVTGDPAVVLEYSTESNSWNERAADSLNSPSPVIGEAHALSADGIFLAATFNSTTEGEVVQVVQYSGEQTDTWNVVGGTIRTGSARELELSSDGSVLAVSGSNAVQVFDWVVTNRTWTQRGGDIAGSINQRESLAMSADGSIVGFLGDSGAVRVFRFEEQAGNWAQLGQDLTGGEFFGHAVVISGDGRRIVISEANFEVSSGPGQVQIFRLSEENTWEQLGQIIEGESGSNDNAGSSVAISEDGSVLVVGANGNNGRVRIYTYNEDANEWQLKETLQVQHFGGQSRFGSAVALTPDGTFLAANSIFDGASVRVYSLNYDCPTSVPTLAPPSSAVPSAAPMFQSGEPLLPDPSPSPAQFDVTEQEGSSSAGLWVGVVVTVLIIAIAGFGGWRWYMKRPGKPPPEDNQESTDSGQFQPVQSVIASFLQASSSGHFPQPSPAQTVAQVEPQVYLPNLPTYKGQCKSVARQLGDVPIATAIPAFISADVHALHKNAGLEP